MGKKGQDRVKGSFQPSSSSRAAELLQNAGPLSFSSFGFNNNNPQSGSGYSSPNLSSSELQADYSGLTNELVVVLKNLNKRNSTTKLKALEELSSLSKNFNESDTLVFFDHWCALYPKLTVDINRRIRFLTNQVHIQLVGKLGKKLASYLKKISGAWICSQFDQSKDTSQLVQTGLNNTFPSDKISKMLQFCQDNIFEYIQYNLLYQTLDNLADPRFYNPEEQVQKYSRVITCSLDGWAYLLENLPSESLPQFEYQYRSILDTKEFWNLAQHQNSTIRSSMYRFFMKFVIFWKDGAAQYSNQLASSFLSKCFGDKDIATHRDLWNTLLIMTKGLPDIWLQTKKPQLPKLFQYLKLRCYGSGNIILPALIVLVDNLPIQIKSPASEFYTNLFEAIYSGYSNQPTVIEKKSLVISTISELLIHGISIVLRSGEWEGENSDKFLGELSFKLIQSSFSNQFYPNSTKISAKYLTSLVNLLIKFELPMDQIQPLLNQLQDFITGLLNGQFPPSNQGLGFDQNLATKVSEFIAQLTSIQSIEPLKQFTQSLVNTLLNNYKTKFNENSFTSEDFEDFATLAESLILSNSKNSTTIIQLIESYLPSYIQQYPNLILKLALVGVKSEEFNIDYCLKLMNAILDEINELEVVDRFNSLILILQGFESKYLPLKKLQFIILNIFNSNSNWLIENSDNSKLLIDLIALSLSNSELLKSTDYHNNQLSTIKDLLDVSLKGLEVNNNNEANLENLQQIDNLLEILTRSKLLESDFNNWIQLILDPQNSLINRVVKLSLIDLNNSQIFDKSNLVLNLWTKYFLKSKDFSGEFIVQLITSYKYNLLSLSGFYLNSESPEQLLNLIKSTEKTELNTNKYANIFMSLIPSKLELSSLINIKGLDDNRKLDTFKGLDNLLGLFLLTQNQQFSNDSPTKELTNLEAFSNFLVSYLNLLNPSQLLLELDELILLINCLLLNQSTTTQNIDGIEPIIIKLIVGNFTQFTTKFPTVLFESYYQLKSIDLLTASSCLNIWTHYLNLFKSEAFSNIEDLNLIKNELELIVEKDEFFGISLLNIFNSIFEESDYSKDYELKLVENYLTNENVDNQLSLTKLAFTVTSVRSIPFNNCQLLFDKIAGSFTNINDETNLINIINYLILIKKLLPSISVNLQKHSQLIETMIELLDDEIINKLTNNNSQKIIFVQSLALNNFKLLERLKNTRTNLGLIWELTDKKLSNNLLNLAIKENYYLEDPINGIRLNYLVNLCELIPSINPLILKDDPPVNQLCNLLKSPSKLLAKSSYLLVRRAIAFQLLKVKQKLDESNTNTSSSGENGEFNSNSTSLLQIPKFLLNNLNLNIEENEQSSNFTYLLSWMSIMDYLEVMDMNLKNEFIEQLKSLDLLNDLILYIIDLLGIKSNKPFDCSIWNFTKIQIRGLENDLELGLPLLGCNLYFRLLRCLPSSVRQWWNSCSNRKLISDFENYTQRYFSKYLIQSEIQAISSSETFKTLQDSNFSIKVLKNEIFGHYLIDENIIDIHIQIPTNFPLLPVKVDGKKHSGVPENRWRAWLLNTSAVFVTQNGTVADAIQLFKKNVQLHFEGVEDCTICYSVIGIIDRSLPNRQCKTCKNKFHSACLFKWFRTSNQSTCPLCRNIF